MMNWNNIFIPTIFLSSFFRNLKGASASTFIFDADIIPTITNTYNIGSSPKRVNEIFVEDLKDVSRIIAKSGEHIAIDLGDSGGIKNLLIRDSGNNAKVTIDSDGNTDIVGDVSIDGDLDINTKNKAIWFDHDFQTNIFSDVPGRLWIYANALHFKLNGTNETDCAQVMNIQKTLRVQPVSTPGIVANRAFIYGKDVSAEVEVHVMDEGGTETQISSHDKDGYYIHKSKIPKRKIHLKIDIERFFRDKFPEYITEKKIKGGNT